MSRVSILIDAVWQILVRSISDRCFGSTPKDNMASILYTASEAGMMINTAGNVGLFVIYVHGGLNYNGQSRSGPFHEIIWTDDRYRQPGPVSRTLCYLSTDWPPGYRRISEIEWKEWHPRRQSAVTVTDEWMKEMIAEIQLSEIWAKVLQRRVEMGYPIYLFTDTGMTINPNGTKTIPSPIEFMQWDRFAG